MVIQYRDCSHYGATRASLSVVLLSLVCLTVNMVPHEKLRTLSLAMAPRLRVLPSHFGCALAQRILRLLPGRPRLGDVILLRARPTRHITDTGQRGAKKYGLRSGWLTRLIRGVAHVKVP